MDDVGIRELQILYAMVNRIRVSPVKWLVDFWISYIGPSKPISFTSLITRITESMDLLEENEVEYIPDVRSRLDEYLFRHIKLMKRDQRNTLKMIYGNHPIEVTLPNESLWLYNAESLTLRLERVERATPVAGTDRMTRARARAAREQAGPSHAAPQEEEHDDPMQM